MVNNDQTVLCPLPNVEFHGRRRARTASSSSGMSPASADSTAFIDEVAITPVVDTLLDGGFERPALTANTFQTDPSGSAWQFSATAGIARNGSDFVTNWTEAQNAPAGAQVGYLQDTGSMSQTVYLDAGTYQLSFLAAQRAIYQTNYQEIEVLVDGAATARSSPSTPRMPPTSRRRLRCGRGYTIELLGLDPLGGDNTAFIDQVTLSANAISDGSFETPALAAATYAIRRLPARPGSSPATAGMSQQWQPPLPPAIPTPPTARRSPSSRATAA